MDKCFLSIFSSINLNLEKVHEDRDVAASAVLTDWKHADRWSESYPNFIFVSSCDKD